MTKRCRLEQKKTTDGNTALGSYNVYDNLTNALIGYIIQTPSKIEVMSYITGKILYTQNIKKNSNNKADYHEWKKIIYKEYIKTLGVKSNINRSISIYFEKVVDFIKKL